MDKININQIAAPVFSSAKKPEIEEDFKQINEKTYDIPKEAADTIKASVLYKKNEPEEFKEFIPLDASPKEVRDILADKKQVGRSFFGFKNTIKNGIKNSKDPQLAIENLNFLLNAENKKLPAATISQVLAITENVNNDSKWTSKYSKKHYGFEGGTLTKESLDNILKVKFQDDMMAAMLVAMTPVYAPMPVPMTPIPVPGMPFGSVMI